MADQESYEGELVTTEGVVTAVSDAPGGGAYHVLEDADANRVLLVPDSVAARYVGQRVSVTGRFTFDPDQGRQVQVERIDPLPAPGSPALARPVPAETAHLPDIP